MRSLEEGTPAFSFEKKKVKDIHYQGLMFLPIFVKECVNCFASCSSFVGTVATVNNSRFCIIPDPNRVIIYEHTISHILFVSVSKYHKAYERQKGVSISYLIDSKVNRAMCFSASYSPSSYFNQVNQIH